MNKKDPKLTVLQFNECINNQNLDGLANLMSEDIALMEGANTIQKGKDANRNAWAAFFNMCPDYKNHFTRIESRENRVFVVGFSKCSNKSVEGPALWTAKVENDLIVEWCILEDTEENRISLEKL
jgi:ketosteroid isomerase-like protein